MAGNDSAPQLSRLQKSYHSVLLYPLGHEMHWSSFCALLVSFHQWKTGIASINALWLSQVKHTYTHIFRYLYYLLLPFTGRAIRVKSFTTNLIHNSTLVVFLAIGCNSHDWVSLPSPAPWVSVCAHMIYCTSVYAGTSAQCSICTKKVIN